MSPKASDGQHRLSCGGGLRESQLVGHLRGLAQDQDLLGIEDGGGRDALVVTGGSAKTKQDPGDWDEESERVEEGLATLELPLLERAAGLQGLEELFDPPPPAVAVDDLQHVLFGIDRLGGDQMPLDRLCVAGRIDLANG